MDISFVNSAHAEFLNPGTASAPAANLSDAELERRLHGLVARESESTADVVEHIGEFDRRRLFAPKSFPSMFEYCTDILGYSAAAAYLRIYAGRLSLEYPELVELLRARRLHLTAIRMVGPHLNSSNRNELIARCAAKTERELKFVIAGVAPKPERAEVIRRLPDPELTASPPPPDTSPEPTPHVTPSPASPVRSKIEPLTPQRVRFAFTGTVEFMAKVDRARQILRKKHPDGSLETIFSEAIDKFLDALDPARKKKPAPPRATDPRRRSAPQWVKDIVFKRDDGRCAYVSDAGRRCGATGGLEYDHIRPWAKGGRSDDPANVRLLCGTHNAFEAERIFGRRLSGPGRR